MKRMPTRILLALLATLVAGALAPLGAAAETGGHFLSEAEEVTVKGTENTTHLTELTMPTFTGIVCDETSYEGKTTKSASKTWTEVTVTPKYSKCKTTGGTAGEITVHVNGCAYVFKIGKKAVQDNTVDLECNGANGYIAITHATCEVKILAQTGILGVAYRPIVESGKAALTVDVTAKIAAQRHGGFCALLATNTTAELKGSATATGSASGSPVSIRALGPEDAEFRSEVSHWSVTGTAAGGSTYTFGELLGSVKCTGATFDGTSGVAETTALTVRPAYTGCSGVKERTVTPHMNGCAYILGATGAEGAHGLAEVECPAGSSIETTVDKFPEGCTITISPQVTGGVVDYKEEGTGTGRKLVLTWTLTGIKYKRDGCEIGGEGINGTVTGSVTLEGEDTSGNPKGIWIE